MPLEGTGRHQALLEALARYVEDSADFGALVLLGSFAKGTADAVSDVDLFFITYRGRFEQAWAHRHELHVTGALVHWDEMEDELAEVGGHRWVTTDLVLVESVISAPQGGARLAAPFKVYGGDSSLVDAFPKRLPVGPGDMTDEGAHPVDVAYDAFKKAVRGGCSIERSS